VPTDYVRPSFSSTAATMFIGGFSVQLFLSVIGALTSRSLKRLFSRKLLNSCVHQGTFFAAWIAQYEFFVKCLRAWKKFQSKGTVEARPVASRAAADGNDAEVSSGEEELESARSELQSMRRNSSFGKMQELLKEYKKDSEETKPPPNPDLRLDLAFAFIAGAVSRYFFGSFSWSTCLLMVMRGLHGLIRAGFIMDVWPRWLHSVPTWVYFLVVNSELVRLAVYQTHFLTKTYEVFATKTGNIKTDQVKYMFQQTPPGALLPPCQPHYHTGACVPAAFSNWMVVMPRAAQMYGSLFLMSKLLFSFKKLIRSPLAEAWSLALQTARSTLFLSLDLTLSKAAACLLKIVSSVHSPLLVRALLGLNGIGILLEPENRQSELLAYCAWQVAQGYVHQFLQMDRAQQKSPRGLMARLVPSLLFGVASVLWVYLLRVCPKGHLTAPTGTFRCPACLSCATQNPELSVRTRCILEILHRGHRNASLRCVV
jgi:hypothetical protein